MLSSSRLFVVLDATGLASSKVVISLGNPMYIDFLTFVVPVLLIATIALQVIATKRIVRDAAFDSGQRSAQMWLVWLVPLFGAATVLAVLQEEPPQYTSASGKTLTSRHCGDDATRLGDGRRS